MKNECFRLKDKIVSVRLLPMEDITDFWDETFEAGDEKYGMLLQHHADKDCYFDGDKCYMKARVIIKFVDGVTKTVSFTTDTEAKAYYDSLLSGFKPCETITFDE